MTQNQRMKNLSVPTQKVDVVLDTDAYNEVDDQFAIAYLLRSAEKLNTAAIYAAPFSNERAATPDEGMEKSYREIEKLLQLMNLKKPVLRGSAQYLKDEQTPVVSEAARDLAERVKQYSPEHPLYVVAIGAITNIASAILMEPLVAQNTVVVWLGGHALHYHDTAEFNMKQDIAAARVVCKSGVPFVQLPCKGVVSEFAISKQELEYWFIGKNELTDYLASNAIQEAERYAAGRAWTRVIWDVTAVAWLLNENDKFMLSRIISTPLPAYNGLYEELPNAQPMRYVYYIRRDALLNNLIQKLT